MRANLLVDLGVNRRFLVTKAATAMTKIAIRTSDTLHITTHSVKLLEDFVIGDSFVGHSGSLGDEMVTEQWGSRVMSTPVTMRLASPPLTHSSIRETRERLSLSEVPSSRARYVTNDVDSLKQSLLINDVLTKGTVRTRGMA